jgi:phospholipase/carboxylesterase
MARGFGKDPGADMQELDGIEREVGIDPRLTIIWLHGLGADATDFVPISGELDFPCATRLVFPNAPKRAVTINGGYVMRAWYDIVGFGADSPQDVEGLEQSASLVAELIARETGRGMPRERIVLAGFSQGGAVVLQAGLGAAAPIGGIVGLSTWLPAPALLEPPAKIATDVPVMLAHGIDDPVIPLELAERARAFLTDHGVAVDWSTWPMAHEVRLDEIRHLSAWLRRF